MGEGEVKSPHLFDPIPSMGFRVQKLEFKRHDNARRNQDQEEYERHYQELVSQFNAAKAKMESLLEEKQSKLDRIEILNAFIASLEDKEAVIDEFSTDLWNLMIQDALVNEDGTIKFVFKNGIEITK